MATAIFGSANRAALGGFRCRTKLRGRNGTVAATEVNVGKVGSAGGRRYDSRKRQAATRGSAGGSFAAMLLLEMLNSSFSLFDFACWLVIFLFSLSAHEAAHALVAQRLGDVTAYLGGQVTLDPIPHIKREPWGMLIVPILSYISSGWMIGWASAPYNPAWAQQYPERAALMAMAGPAANFTIAFISWCGLKLGLLTGVFVIGNGWSFSETVISTEPGLWHLAAALLSLGFSLNVLLGIFNLIPLPPLDGSALPLLFLHDEMARTYQRLSRSTVPALLGLFVAWQFFPRIFRPLYAWLEWTLRG